MSDVDEIIDFIKQLKKGFDKELFQSKIDELAYIAETTGLDSEDFYILFKIWLNLSIPITKWQSLGACLVPQNRVEERSVDYAFRWLLANCDSHSNFSRMAFLLDWLTAAMDCDSIDMTALDSGYEIFYTMLSFEVLTAHALKLVYTLTKPSDVTRKRVLELLDLAKMREGKKNMYRQIQVLLGLFKSYKPECVPESIPAISVHTLFKKINSYLLARFKKRQEHRNSTTKERHHLMWSNPLNDGGRNKKAEPLVPNMEFTNIGSDKYSDKGEHKTHLDISEPVSVVSASAGGSLGRPSRLRALLCNQAGLALLALAPPEHLAFFNHDLHHLLTSCFLTSSPHSYVEKADLLHRLGSLQCTLLQGIPVITRFLAQYLPFWNEKDYFPEILCLVEWVHVDSADQLMAVVEPLVRSFHRAEPLAQCAILRALTNMYCNLVYSSTRTRQYFGSSRLGERLGAAPRLANTLARMCSHALQSNPEDMRILYSSITAVERCARFEARFKVSAGALPRALTLTLPLMLPSAVLVDKIAGILMLYRKIMSHMKSTNNKEAYIAHRRTLESYTADFLNCLYHEQAITERNSGLIFTKVHPQLVAKLTYLVPSIDSVFSIRNNLGFFTPIEGIEPSQVTHKLCFETVVSQFYPNLSAFLVKAVPDLN